MSMGMTIIPRAFAKGDDLIVIPRKEYERLRSYEHDTDDDVDCPILLEEVSPENMTEELLRAFRKAKRTPKSKMLNI